MWRFEAPIGTSLDGKIVLHSRRNSSGVEDVLPDLEANLEAPRSLSDAKVAITGIEFTDNGVRTENLLQQARRGCGAIFAKFYQATDVR